MAPSAASGLICIISFVWPERLQRPVCGVDTLGGRDLLLLGIRPLRAATTAADVREFTSRMCSDRRNLRGESCLCGAAFKTAPTDTKASSRPERIEIETESQTFYISKKFNKTENKKKNDQNLFLNACLLLNQTARAFQLQPRPSGGIKQLLFENVTCTQFHFNQKR